MDNHWLMLVKILESFEDVQAPAFDYP